MRHGVPESETLKQVPFDTLKVGQEFTDNGFRYQKREPTKRELNAYMFTRGGQKKSVKFPLSKMVTVEK